VPFKSSLLRCKRRTWPTAEGHTDSDEAIAVLVQQLEKEDVKRDQLNESRQEMSVAEALVEVVCYYRNPHIPIIPNRALSSTLRSFFSSSWTTMKTRS
jgi:hypothetical protein